MAMETHRLQAEKFHWQLTADQEPPMCQKTTMSTLNSISRGNIDNKCEGVSEKTEKEALPNPSHVSSGKWQKLEQPNFRILKFD